MSGDAPLSDRSTAVALPPPRRSASRRPDLDEATVRARLRAAETALLDERRLLDGRELSDLAVLPDQWVTSMAALAHQVRLAWCGPGVEVEGILSAKTGGCPEDCHFCAQSSRFSTPVQATPFLDPDEVLRAAEETRAAGASEFCIVLAVRGPDERTMQRILELVPLVQERTGLNVAVSAGLLTEEQARRFAACGVHRYNHNLETSRSFFPNVVTTHTWEEREATCRLVRGTGWSCAAVPSSAWARPTSSASSSSSSSRSSIRPRYPSTSSTRVPARRSGTHRRWRPGMPSAGSPSSGSGCPVSSSAMRAAGRSPSRELQSMGMTSGINALIVGNYLTTLGRSPEEDLQMLSDLRMPVGALTGVL